MANNITPLVSQLRTLSPQLNKTADDTNRVVREVDHFLSEECGIGLPAEVVVANLSERLLRIDVDYEGDTEVYEISLLVLCYARSGGRFHICFNQRTQEERRNIKNRGDDFIDKIKRHSIPWDSAPRRWKLQAFPELPKLLEAIAEEVIKSAQYIDTTTELLRSMMSAVKSPSSIETT